MRLPIIAWVYDRRHVGTPKKEATVELRITYQGRQKFISTGVRVLPKEWRHGMIVNRLDAQELNKSLEIILTNVRRTVNDMLEEGVFVLDELPRRLQRAMGGEKSFLTFCRERSKVRCYGRSTDSIQRYNRFLRFFEAWGRIKYFGDITDHNIILMASELKERGMKPYSAWNNYHRFLNSFIIDAIQEGYIKRNPYKWLHIDKDKKSHALDKHLTKQELHTLMAAKMPTPCLERVRDLFVFQTYTCMAYIDLADFDFAQCRDYGYHKLYSGKRAKTGQEFSFVLLGPAIKILERYDYRLPLISNVKYNQHLKVVAQAAHIDKPLTTHWARHTGATLLLNDGVDMEVVAKILGHSSTRITRKVYAKMLDDTVAREMASVEGKL